MVVSTSEEPYSPFQHPAFFDEGPQSSEEGSGLHSPVFGSQFPVTDNFRYPIPLRHQLQAPPAGPFIPHHSALKFEQSPSPVDSFDLSPTSPFGFIPSPSTYSVNDTGRFPLDFGSKLPPEERPLPGGPSYHTERYSHAIQPVPPDSSANVTTDASRESRKEKSSSVVIACRQCRSRKIRCDSLRPACRNCSKRSTACEYDSTPKRRGPDRRPGTRQRSCKKRPSDGSSNDPPPPKRTRTSPSASIHSPPPSASGDASPELEASMVASNRPPPTSSTLIGRPLISFSTPRTELHISTDPRVLKQQSTPSPLHHGRPQHSPYTLHSPPAHQSKPYTTSSAIDMMHALWWHDFIAIFPLNDIIDSVKYLFRDADSSSWLSFLHHQLFIKTLLDPQERPTIEPAFVLATLALTTLMRSSELGYGHEGRQRALQWRDDAQARIDISLAAGSEDPRLADASLIITLFEMSVHPEHHPDRLATALRFMDDLIKRLQLTTFDLQRGDPDVSRFLPNDVPSVQVAEIDRDSPHCTCIFSDGSRPSPSVSMSNRIPWDPKWSRQEVRNEEIRRLCWCALGLVASYTARYTVFANDLSELPSFHLTEPSNYGILFPGEISDRQRSNYSASPPRHKETIWAVYCRSILLWCYCNRVDLVMNYTEDRKADFAQRAWGETQSLHDSIEMHICNMDTELLYLAKEYVFNARTAITRVLRSLHGLDVYSQRTGLGLRRRPVFNRKQAEEWLYYQDQVATRVYNSAKDIATLHEDHHLIQRPYQVTWFTNQLALCLLLWDDDKSLTNALDLGKCMMVVVDLMNALWPCPAHQKECDNIRATLTQACLEVGLEPPVSPHISLPPMLRPPLPSTYAQQRGPA